MYADLCYRLFDDTYRWSTYRSWFVVVYILELFFLNVIELSASKANANAASSSIDIYRRVRRQMPDDDYNDNGQDFIYI